MRNLISLILVTLISLPLCAETLRDPMQPPGSRSPSAPTPQSMISRQPGKVSYRLSSIVITDSQRRAVINGRPLTVGDRLNGAVVETIEANRVVLAKGGRSIPIQFLPLTIKQPSEANGQ